MQRINILFARSDSHYKKLKCVEVFDKDRNALTVKNNYASVCHPPCRAWGKLNGGVLEHPYNSSLFKKYRHLLDGGITVRISQVWFGHKARKETMLFIKGLALEDLPTYKVLATKPTHVVARIGKRNPCGGYYCSSTLPALSKKEREMTPSLAIWLAKICRRIETKKKENNGVLAKFGQLGLKM